MIYLLTHFWAWGVSAFAVGLATALFIVRRPEGGPVAGWLIWFVLAFAAGLPVAALALLPGRPGFWLEMALMLFPAFLAGAAVGALLGRHSLRDNEGWAIGLVPLALIWLGAGFVAGRSTEQDLKRKAASAIEKVGGDPADLDVAGRDVLLPLGVANRAAAEEQLERIPDVRRVAEAGRPPSSAAKLNENAATARRNAREAEASATPSREAPGDSPPQSAPDLARPSAAPSGEPARPGPPAINPDADPAGPAALARPEQGATADFVPASGALDIAACQRAVSAALAREPVQFSRRGAGVRRGATGALDKTVGLLQRCPQAEVEARVRSEGGDLDARRLARDRAARIVDYLGRMGVERGRLSVAGENGNPEIKDAPENESGSGVELRLTPRR